MKTEFSAAQFTPTEWDTAEVKAEFANRFVRFVESGYKPSLFTKKFYVRLSITFGHIAHYDQNGFWSTFFTSNAGKLRFIEATMNGGGYGSPAFTYSDVERELKTWAHETKQLEKARAELHDETEARERAVLANLKAKYEPAR